MALMQHGWAGVRKVLKRVLPKVRDRRKACQCADEGSKTAPRSTWASLNAMVGCQLRQQMYSGVECTDSMRNFAGRASTGNSGNFGPRIPGGDPEDIFHHC